MPLRGSVRNRSRRWICQDIVHRDDIHEVPAIVKPIELLLVEDSVADILLMHQALTLERSPISVRVAADGKQAIQMLARRDFRPDLVIVDLGIPKFSELSMLKKRYPGVPVIVITASRNPLQRRKASQLGARKCLQKPTNLGGYRRALSPIIRNCGKTNRQVAV